ncbi:helix-turn-helix domain-containing protein [Thioalkalivibrio sp. ALMg11]|uniref:helix-turn-helix domain-containing protein n=1 Tax=Thioalkalivibrio sp. ALMg11 TaxID=1158165 RepID=UPI000361E934|nr:helix-turn-helix domain-containing protein [Thioalkalivibrio sp. ALMg11]
MMEVMELPYREEDAALDQAACEWLEGRMDANEFACLVQPRVERIAFNVAGRFGLFGSEEDLAQECLALLFEKRGWNPEAGASLSSYLFGCAQNIANARTKRFDHREVYSVGEVFDAVEASAQAGQSATAESRPFEVIEGVEMARRSARIDASALRSALKELEPRKRSRKDTRHLRGNETLQSIRDRAGLTREEMAQGLGIETWRYQSYETGKAKPPERFQDRARDYAESARPPQHFDWLHTASSKDIVGSWMEMLGVSLCDPLLQEVTGKTFKTLQRWYNADQKPKVSGLAQCHAAVLAYLAQPTSGGTSK